MPTDAHPTVTDHDVFLLRALLDGVTVGGVRLTRPNTFTRCEILLPVDATGSAGAPLCFVERPSAASDIVFYSDATRTTELLRVAVRPRYDRTAKTWWRKVASLVSLRDTPYDVTQADGTRLGVIHKDFAERTYRVSDAAETPLMTAFQEFEPVATKDLPGWAALRRPLADDRFAFRHGDRQLGWLQPDRRTRTDNTIDMTLDRDRSVDRRLALAVACIDVLRPRNEGE